MTGTFENIEAERRFKEQRYRKFLEDKIIQTPAYGFLVDKESLSDILKPHQADICHWSLEGGRRAIFASFGLGKSIMQLEIASRVIMQTGKPFLIGMPLGVKQEFYDDAELLGVTVKYVRSQEEINPNDLPCIYLSNYERIRDAKFNPNAFGGVSFDEGDAIRNLDTETTDYILNSFGQVPYRFIATATPSPNDYTELLNYAQFLGVMDRGQALTRFFQRNSTTAGDLTLYPHKVDEFWLWVRSWAVIIQKPSDLNPEYSDEGYDLPELKVFYHEVKVKERAVITDRDGNYKMFRDTSKGLVEASKEKRESLKSRLIKSVEIINESPDDHWLIWHHLEDERKMISQLLPDALSVYGSQKMDEREETLIGFKKGTFPKLSTKPEIAGSGCNFQAHCHKAIFVGIDYRFKDFIQAIHRILRYGQKFPVEIHIVYSDAELDVLKVLEQKWNDHREMQTRMSEIMRKYGLSSTLLIEELRRTIGVERQEVTGDMFKAIYNDSVIEAINMEDNSIDCMVSSIPFSDQYEYCESYHDMGHNDGNDEFFKQMDFLTTELYRVLKPGRVACIHVKNRIRFSYQNGFGFTDVLDFRGDTIRHFRKHGFSYLGEHTIPTDVVSENSQTYRLGWTEMCKDGTKMGAGSPEWVLVFRKPPTDKSNAYADEKVHKSKKDYSRGRWQIDAHGLWNTSGNRLLSSEELRSMDLSGISKWWKEYCERNPYNYQDHVWMNESLDSLKKLSASFMLLPPYNDHTFIWDDINRMRTLNTNQALKKKEKHVCPLQFDVVARCVEWYSNPGDKVWDFFGGLMTVPYICIQMGRYGIGSELNKVYWSDGVQYCRSAEYKMTVPTLFDVIQ